MPDAIDDFLDRDEVDDFLDAPGDFTVDSSGQTPNQNYGIDSSTSTARNQQAGIGQLPPFSPAGPVSRAANFIAEEGTPAAGAMLGATASLPFMAAAGPLAPLVPIAGAAIGAMGARGLQRTFQYGAGQREIPSTGEAVADIGAAGIAGAEGEAGGRLLAGGLKAIAPGARRVGAQVMRAMTGVPEREGIAVLRDPGILSRAKPVAESGKIYSESVQGLQGGAKGARASLGKSHFSGEAIADKFDELAGNIADDTIDTQTALTLRQRTMKAINDLPYNQRELRGLLAENIDTLDTVLERRLPNWGGARTGYRESKIAEEFGSWLPLNKNLSPNVLRTTAAIAAAGKGAIEGRPWLAAGLPLISPKVWGLGIRGAAAGARAMTSAPGELAARTGVQSVADEYMRRRNPQP